MIKLIVTAIIRIEIMMTCNVTATPKYFSKFMSLGIVTMVFLAHFVTAEESLFQYEASDDNTITITGYTGPSEGELNVPAEINGMPVTNIARRAFQHNNFTAVRVPENVAFISTSAFTGNDNLRNVYLPASLEHIMRRSFSFSAQFHVDEANESFRSVDGILFSRDMTRMKAFPSGRTGEYTIPETVTWIRGDVFRYSQLSNVHIHDGVTYFGRLAFNGMENLTEIRLPASLDTLGERGKQFENCVNLRSIILPEGITILPREIFKGCTSLASITLPENLETIHYGAFRDCVSLQSINLPESLSVMHHGVFRGCENLAHITLPNNLAFIADHLFRDCKSLTHIVIPASVSKIGDRAGHAFFGCDALTKIYFLGDAPEVLGDNNFPQSTPRPDQAGEAGLTIYHTAEASGWPGFGEPMQWMGYPTQVFHPDDLP